MLFDVQSALAEIMGASPATTATPATNGPNVASAEGVAAQRPEIPPSANVLPFAAQPSALAPKKLDQERTLLHGVSDFSDRPRTWTGKVVALDEWRRLSDWEREGPAGRLWSGLCRAWVANNGGCRVPGCWNRNGAE